MKGKKTLFTYHTWNLLLGNRFERKTISFLKETLWEDFYYLRVGEDFLNKTQKLYSVKGNLINSTTFKE